MKEKRESPPGLFITGADTGIGKTHVGVRLARAWRQAGRRIEVFKPAESGCVDGRPADALALLEAAQSDRTIQEVCPYRLAAPLAPAVAAAREGVRIDFDFLRRRVSELAAATDALLVEGAGGLLVPLTGSQTYLDFILAAGLPVLIVAGNKLGCINHTLLTERALLAAGARVIGITMNNFQGTAAPDALSNPEEIERMARSPLLGVWPYCPAENAERLRPDEERLAARVWEAWRAG